MLPYLYSGEDMSVYVQKKFKSSLIGDLRNIGGEFIGRINDESGGEFCPLIFIGNWNDGERPSGCTLISDSGEEERYTYYRCIWLYQGITSLTLSKYTSQPILVDNMILGNIIEPEQFTYVIELIEENINGGLFGKILEAIKPIILSFLTEDEDFKTIRERFHVSAYEKINKERQSLARAEADSVRNLTDVQVKLGIVDNAISILESGNGTENIEREAEKIKELKKDGIIDSLSIRNGYLRVMFSKFMYKPANKIKFEVGPILLKYKIHNGTIKTYHQEDTYKSKGGYFHPHIDGGGNCCFGNMQDTIYTMFKACRIVEAISMFRVFLESYDDKNPHIRLDKFMPPDPKKEKKAKEKGGVGARVGEGRSEPIQAHRTGATWIASNSSLEGMEIGVIPEEAPPQPQPQESNPCEGCEQSGSPFCAQECEYGQGGCDDCQEIDEPEFCSLDCRYNGDWQQYNPCLDCNNRTCLASVECVYLVRAVMNGIVRHPCDPEAQALQGTLEDESLNNPVTPSARERWLAGPGFIERIEREQAEIDNDADLSQEEA